MIHKYLPFFLPLTFLSCLEGAPGESSSEALGRVVREDQYSFSLENCVLESSFNFFQSTFGDGVSLKVGHPDTGIFLQYEPALQLQRQAEQPPGLFSIGLNLRTLVLNNLSEAPIGDAIVLKGFDSVFGTVSGHILKINLPGQEHTEDERFILVELGTSQAVDPELGTPEDFLHVKVIPPTLVSLGDVTFQGGVIKTGYSESGALIYHAVIGNGEVRFSMAQSAISGQAVISTIASCLQ